MNEIQDKVFSVNAKPYKLPRNLCTLYMVQDSLRKRLVDDNRNPAGHKHLRTIFQQHLSIILATPNHHNLDKFKLHLRHTLATPQLLHIS